jgi:hypothetical protein
MTSSTFGLMEIDAGGKTRDRVHAFGQQLKFDAGIGLGNVTSVETGGGLLYPSTAETPTSQTRLNFER